MNSYPHQIKVWRSQFSEVSSKLRSERNRLFERQHLRMMSRIRLGGQDGLRTLAKELQASGVYSSKIGVGNVELMLMSRLRRTHPIKYTWHEFVSHTVGLSWLESRRRCYRTQ